VSEEREKRDERDAREERTYHVDVLTRVEGEGRFVLQLKEGRVVRSELAIFEAPRFFEAFLRGRDRHEVVDVVARICGICPVAYQMSAALALEAALNVAVPDPIRRLRRLLYCGEWIESHALHVFLLHAPDFLGFPSAIEMAAEHRELVERGLRMKKIGNAILETLGGRATHPVSPRIGGFSKVPTRERLRALREDLATGLRDAELTVTWAASLPMPPLDVEYVYVALDAPEYPLEGGDTILVGREGTTERVPIERFDEHFVERQVPHSNALQATLHDGTTYLTGPAARLHHHAERLHPRARAAMEAIALPRSVRNPHQFLVVRALELVHAFAEALELVDAYVEPREAFVPDVIPAERSPADSADPSSARVGFGATEAPRGLLWHRYELDEDGLVRDARIVPPTSQNQARIEADLVAMAPALLALPHDEATALCERLIRSYDPCISCATHFLDLRIEGA